MSIAYLDVITVNRAAFENRLRIVCTNLGIDPSWLMITIKMESGFNRKAKNKYSGAVGLIQWIPRYVKSTLGFSSHVPDWMVQQKILRMSGVEQLKLIEKFLWPYRKKMTDQYQVYLAVFNPAAMGKPDNFVIGERGSKTYNWNKILDQKYGDNDGILEVSDVKKFVDKFTPSTMPKITTMRHENRRVCPTCLRAFDR